MLKQKRYVWSIVFVVICLVGCSSVFANIFRWRGEVYPANNNWEDIGNWEKDWAMPATNFPTALDTVYMMAYAQGSYAEITQPGALGYVVHIGSEQNNAFWQIGGGLTVQNNGSLAATIIYVGVRAVNQSFMVLNGGTVTATAGTYVGKDAAAAVDNSLTINSGLLHTKNFAVNIDAWGDDEGAHADIYGGELYIDYDFTARNSASQAAVSICNNGILRWDYGRGYGNFTDKAIQISGNGKFLIAGDRTETGDSFAVNIINDNWVVSGDGGTLQWDYNITTPGYTTIITAPYPNIAHNPNPFDKSDSIELDNLALSWSPGDKAIRHDVYTGTSYDEVNEASIPDGDLNYDGLVDWDDMNIFFEQWLGTIDNNSADFVYFAKLADNWMQTGAYKGRQDVNSYTPGSLAIHQDYYWRIDEVNDLDADSPWKGTVWRFTTKDSIDDFETYSTSEELISIWDANNGTIFLSTLSCYDGAKSMKCAFQNSVAPYYSEFTRTFQNSQDWIFSNGNTLALFFHGINTNSAESMYITLTDIHNTNATVYYNKDPNHLIQDSWELWQCWTIELQDFNGIDLSNISKIGIGIGDQTAGSDGSIYIDDIRIYNAMSFYPEDYGAVADGVTDCSSAIQTAVEKAINAGPGSKVQLGVGTYKIATTFDENMYFYVNQAYGITIAGEGTNTELLATNPQIGDIFYLNGCDSVVLKDFAIDYDPLPFTQGTIVAVNTSAQTFDVDIESGYPLPNESWFSSSEWGMVYDSTQPKLKSGVAAQFFYTSWTYISGRVWRYTMDTSRGSYVNGVSVNDRFVHQAVMSGRGCVHIHNSQKNTVQNVTIYSAPALCVLLTCNFGQNIIDNLTVKPRPSTTRLMSSDADGVHCQRNRKGPIIKNCYFEQMGDDMLNIYGVAHTVTQVVSSTQARVTDTAGRIHIGDRLQILHSTGLRGDVVVSNIQEYPTNGDIITFTSAPVNLSVGDTIYSHSDCGEGYVISNNNAVRCRGSATLRAGNGVFKNNTIEDSGFVAMRVVNNPDWNEGPIPNNITIHNNTFIRCGHSAGNAGETNHGVIWVAALMSGGQFNNNRGVHGITISDNTFTDPLGAAIFVSNGTGIQISGNSSTAQSTAAAHRSAGTVELKNCDGVVVDDLTVNDVRATTIAALVIGSDVTAGTAGVTVGTINATLNGNSVEVLDNR